MVEFVGLVADAEIEELQAAFQGPLHQPFAQQPARRVIAPLAGFVRRHQIVEPVAGDIAPVSGEDTVIEQERGQLNRAALAEAACGLPEELAIAGLGEDVIALGLDKFIPLHAHHGVEKVGALFLIAGNQDANIA